MKVAVMGYGTVGSGVCEVIETHQDTLAKRTGGKALELARILDLREFPGDKHEALFTKDFNDILNDPEIQIVAETMGGVNPAFDFTMKLLASGKRRGHLQQGAGGAKGTGAAGLCQSPQCKLSD